MYALEIEACPRGHMNLDVANGEVLIRNALIIDHDSKPPFLALTPKSIEFRGAALLNSF